MINLIELDELRLKIRDALRERATWVFVPVDDVGVTWLVRIEKRFYSGRRAADYALIAGVLDKEPFLVALGKKKGTTPAQFEKLLGVSAAGMGPKDIVILMEEDAAMSARMRWFRIKEWLRDRHGEEPVGGMLENAQ